MEFIDLKAQYRALKPKIDANIQAVLNAGQFIGGPYVKALEEKLCAYVGRKHCITCGNGTDALQAAYMALGVGEGDAVFCPDCTFIASVEPANMLGGTPVFCDVSMDSYNLDPESLERQIQAVLSEGKLKPRVVVAVDFLGNPCDYDAIAAICDKYGLTLLEDAAQSMGASYKGKMCCSFGTISTTSFFPAKTLGCYGDGGAIFTDNDALADLLRSICVHGKGPGGKYDNIRVGVNSRLDNLQAAILLPKLEALTEYEIRDREAAAGRYGAAFAGRFDSAPRSGPRPAQLVSVHPSGGRYRSAGADDLPAERAGHPHESLLSHSHARFAGVPGAGDIWRDLSQRGGLLRPDHLHSHASLSGGDRAAANHRRGPGSRPVKWRRPLSETIPAEQISVRHNADPRRDGWPGKRYTGEKL